MYNLREIPEALQTTEKIGGKALGLYQLMNADFSVPSGWVITNNRWEDVLSHNNAEEIFLDTLCKDLPLEEKSRVLQASIEEFSFPTALTQQIKSSINPEIFYAVRSSGMMEDLADSSFAGQYETVLNVKGIDAVLEAVKTCYQSLYAENVLSYLENSGSAAQGLSMAVVVQEMVDADKSGVAFSLNPITGADTEYIIEVAEGLGDRLVSGQVNPVRYGYDWFKEGHTLTPEEELLSQTELNELLTAIGAVAELFGYPVDIEFSFKRGKLYLLQARAITKIRYSGLVDMWSTADFKDGGVSATVCTPFMWSLYEYIWEISFKEFLVGTHIIKEKDMRKLGDMFYGRPYWNLSVTKEAMAKIPGYKEREFDKEFGIGITYEGDGDTTSITPKSLVEIARIALAQSRLVRETKKQAKETKEELLSLYKDYKEKLLETQTIKELEKIVRTLTKQDYLKSEGTYFTQIFINTVHQAMFKDTILKYVDDSGYFSIIGGLEDISHLRPFYYLWDLSRDIRKDSSATEYWQATDQAVILDDLSAGETNHFLPKVQRYLVLYGYHSEKELDITFPCYEEAPASIIAELCQLVGLEDSYSPVLDQQKQNQRYKEETSRIRKTQGERKGAKLEKKVEDIRDLLWWREEFRDISTRFYYIIRKYMLALGEKYEKEGILENADDVWFFKIEELWQYLDKKITIKEFKQSVLRRRRYYNSYRNFQSENEIGSKYVPTVKPNGNASLVGIGANTGTVTGTARVIEGLEYMDRIEKDDILITRFTDTGWTSKFVLLSGIVTEYGGVLCHAAIVSREYGIPCIVCAENATQKIIDGSTITIDGVTGEITIH